jgi:thiamine biosynthesis lipoprotein ApbE
MVDPVRGTAVVSGASVSVIASKCAVADALTKVVMLKQRAAFRLLHTFSASAVIVTPDNQVIASKAERRVP